MPMFLAKVGRQPFRCHGCGRKKLKEMQQRAMHFLFLVCSSSRSVFPVALREVAAGECPPLPAVGEAPG